jgi:hypothetical protein
VDNFDGSFFIFRATEMMAPETECGDSDACFAKLSKRDGHGTPSQWFLGSSYEDLDSRSGIV